MAAATERLERLPYGEAILWTFKRNVRAIGFYETLGWRFDGAEKIHPGSGEPAIRMRRRLDGQATISG
jgi:ribosomal protein S18 acetylase RimI-like enzyme